MQLVLCSAPAATAAVLQAFELTLDIDRLVREVDLDRSGYLDYAEFKAVMS